MRRYLPGGAFILFCCMVIGKVVSYYDNKQLDYAADKVQSVVALPAEEAEQGTGVEYSFFAFPTHVEVSDEFRRDWGDDSWIAQDFVDSYQRSTQSTLRTEQVAFIKTEIVPRLRTIAWICSEEGAKRPAQYEADFKQAIEYFGPTIYHSISAVGL